MTTTVLQVRRAALPTLAALLLAPGAVADSGSAATRSVAAGTQWIIEQPTRLGVLDIAPGATVTASGDRSLTLTVDGVETAVAPGHYTGDVRLTPSDPNIVTFAGMPGAGGGAITHHLREALYLDATGIVANKSVLAAAGRPRLAHGVLSGAQIRSVGENFNGVYVAGGHYTLAGASINFTGNGGNDFAGYGAAVMSTGKGTTLVVDHARIRTHGAIRTAVIADDGSHLIVRNSDIATRNGVLPADYVSNVTPGEMKDVPWMLGLRGNCRATNLLGDNTQATYINSSIAAEGWGVLSIDASSNTHLTAIDSRITVTGESGYGSYAIGNSLNAFYGTRFDVADYGVIITGGSAVFGASTPATLQRLNDELQLGLTRKELAAIERRPTVVHSKRFGVMWHGDGSVKVGDDTVFETGQTAFLVKGARATITVDGSHGARLHAGNGVLVQIMDNDDPGPVMVDGVMVNKGVYHEPTNAPAKIVDFDVGSTHDTDVVASLSDATLRGDLYNAVRGGGPAGGMPPGMGAPEAGGPTAGMGPLRPASRNLVVHLARTRLTGVISASTARHFKDTIGAADYRLLGVVRNMPAAAINNGVIVDLDHSTWTVTGTSYLTSLTLDADSRLLAPRGRVLTLKVNGEAHPVAAGSFHGNVVLEIGGH